jgi:hypothetical protein
MSRLKAFVVAWMLLVAAAINAAAADDPVPAFLPQGRSKAFLGVVSAPNAGGATISSVVPQSSAFEIGIEAGDVIQEIDGFKIGVINGAVYSLPSEIRRSGEEVELVVRDQNTGAVYNRTAKVGGRATNKGTPNSVPRLGLSSRIDERGETVLQVFPNTAAAMAGIVPGDLVTHVDGYRVAVIDGNVYSLASEIRHSPSGCALTVVRGGQPQNVVVSFGARPISTARVHLLLVGLTDDAAIGRGAAANLDVFELLAEQIPAEKLGTVKRIDGANCRASTLLSEIRALNVATDEAIFVYYAGHGGYDPNVNPAQDPTGGHFFQIPGGDLMRKTVWESLAAKGARLTVLITDTCNVSALPVDVAGAPMAQPMEPPFVTLLLRHRGVVDISGTTRGQFGWYNQSGGIFTKAFVYSVVTGSGNWGDVLGASTNNTKELYKVMKREALASPTLVEDVKNSLMNQAEQAPQAFRFDVRQD